MIVLLIECGWKKEPIGVVISLGLGLQYRHAIDGWTILQKLGNKVNIIVCSEQILFQWDKDGRTGI